MAANYDQPPYVEKRVRFFDGQYLQDQDFVDEQKFHVDRQRRHNRTLHIAGIADGLRVSKATDAPARVTVAVGTAVDSDGRQLVLAKDQNVDLPGSQLANKTVNLYLVYREQPADLQTQAGSKDHSRWLEQPEIRAVTKGEAPGGNFPPVLLAELVLDGSGSITDVNSNVRQYSGLRLPGPNADGPTLRTDTNGLVRLDGGLTVTGKVGIGTTDPKASLHVNGELRIDGARTIINGFDGANKHWIKTNAAEPGSVFMAFSGTGDGNPQAVHIIPGNSSGLTVNSDGNVGIGIGTTSPGGKLDVSGVADTAAQVSLQLRSGNSGANYNSNQITLGYNNTAQYRHAIKTRHHGGQKAGNAIDFYVWKQGTDTADAIGSLHTLTLDGGNVGIGTTTPDSKLTITAIQQSAESGITQTVANNGLNIEANYLADNYLPGIVWTTNDNNPTKPKAGIWISEHATGSRLYLGTSNNYSTGITNKAITIHESGTVGIGTTTIKQQLTVNGRIYIESGVIQRGGDAITGTSDLGLYSQVDGNWMRFVTKNAPIRFFTDGGIGTTACLSIDQAGKVGIGTTGPAGKLDVQGSVYVGTGSNSENYKLVIRGPNSPNNANSYQDLSYEFAAAGSAKIRAYRGSSWDTYLQFLTNSSNAGSDNAQVRMTIDHVGNVGIGTTSPAQKLMVVGANNAGKDPDSGMTAGGQLAIKGDAPQLDFIDTDHNDWSIHVNSNKMYFIRQPWNYTDLVLDGSGNVGIGTDTPQATLHVAGSLKVAGGQSVSGIPIIDFQSKRQSFSGHTGSRKQLAYTFTFSRPVTKAEAMLRSWYLVYQNREYVKEMGVFIDNSSIQISGNTVTVLVDFYLRDSTGAYDDAYNGDAIVVVIAQLSQAV